MKSIKAFLIALMLFLITVGGIYLLTNRKLPSYSLAYGTWIDHSKYGSHDALEELLSGKSSIPIFGSSELRHGQKSGFHANTIFRNSDIEPVFIGEAGYQCLSQAITLGSLGDELSGKKVVLVVSPQWLKKKGVLADAFGNSFSEDNFIAFLKNKTISDKTRNYIIHRAKKLSKGNSVLYKKICNDIRWYSGDQLGTFDSVQKEVNEYIVRNKAITGVETRMKLMGVSGGPEKSDRVSVDQETWDKLYAKAEQKGEKIASGNPLGMYDKIYNRKYEPMLDAGDVKNPKYTAESIELKDMESFLQICQENHIKPMVVVLPFNGYWYDAIGYDSNQRTAVYQAIAAATEKYHATYADLSSHEYDNYYFEDNSHPALKGLVNLNETIYKFYRGNEK